MIQAYVGDGSGFHTQVAIYEQGYSNSFTFALALYRDGTALLVTFVIHIL